MSSIPLAIAFGVASAVVYGASIVVQHRVVNAEGDAGASGLKRVIRDPRWLLAICGDGIGFLLQIVALSTGPVVLVQPLVVLMLPVALAAAYVMGGSRPQLGDYLGAVAVVGGLGGFLAIIGTPGVGHVPHARRIAMAVVAVLFLVAVVCLCASFARPVVRGAVYGGSAGACFGTLAVMVDAASDRVSTGGFHALVTTGRGIVPLVAIAILGLTGMVLTMVSFQIGSLSATLPANLAADPLTAVIFGALLLHEHIPSHVGVLVGYLVCLLAVIVGAARLAVPATASPKVEIGPSGRIHRYE